MVHETKILLFHSLSSQVMLATRVATSVSRSREARPWANWKPSCRPDSVTSINSRRWVPLANILWTAIERPSAKQAYKLTPRSISSTSVPPRCLAVWRITMMTIRESMERMIKRSQMMSTDPTTVTLQVITTKTMTTSRGLAARVAEVRSPLKRCTRLANAETGLLIRWDKIS